MSIGSAVPCLMRAWEAHARSLRGWAAHHVPDRAQADDLLQDVFIKALGQGSRFCALDNPRAWLFEVARNTLADRFRYKRDTVELPDDLLAEEFEISPVDSLVACLPRVLSELSAADREAVVKCDIEGMSQAEFAHQLGLSLPGAKSRVQRARQRLKAHLQVQCTVRLDEQGHVCSFSLREPFLTADV